MVALGTGALGTGEAHAKSILLGEHAAVYGYPAIALPVTALRTVADLREAPGPLALRAEGRRAPVADLPTPFIPVGVAATTALEHFGLPTTGVELALRTNIPPRAGLGASAAAAHAIVEAVRAYADEELDEETRFTLVQTAERVAHGNPSGLDARATRTDVPILLEAGSWSPLTVGHPMWFAVADTGVRASTGDAVEGVRRVVESDPGRGRDLLEHLGELTRGAVTDLAHGQVAALGERLLAAQEALGALGVGHEAIDRLVAAAGDAGAPGAKLTGAGRGGCVIAVGESAAHAAGVLRAMEDAGAVAGWVVPVGAP